MSSCCTPHLTAVAPCSLGTTWPSATLGSSASSGTSLLRSDGLCGVWQSLIHGWREDIDNLLDWACRNYNWYSVEKQLDSVAMLADLPFLHVMPGHGRPGSFSSDSDRVTQIQQMLEREGHMVAA